MGYTNLTLSPEQIAKDGLWLVELDSICSNSNQAELTNQLALSVAVRNLCGWLEDPRIYNDRHHRNKWGYAIQDLKETAAVIGPKLTAELGSQLSSSLNSLSGLLPSRNQPLPANSAPRVDSLAKQKALLAKAGSHDSIVQAWRDVVEACKSSLTSTEELSFLALTLWDLCELSGLDTDGMGVGSTLSRILSDDAFSIAIVLADLGERDYPIYSDFENHEAKAGLSVGDRLKICEKLLSMSITDTDNIVWLGIERAGIDKMTLGYGPVKFYESEWLRGNLFDDGPSRGKLPAELIDENNRLSEHDLPKGNNVLAVRVDMSNSSRVNAVSDARKILNALLIITTPNSNDWKLLDGHTLYVDGHPRSMRMFGAGAADRFNEYSRNYDSTQIEIERLKAEFTPIVPNIDPRLTEVLEARKWIKDTADADPLSRILAYVRSIEQLSSWVNGGTLSWYEFTRRYVKEGWALNQLQDEVNEGVYHALTSTMGFDESSVKQIDSLKAGVIEYRENGFRMHLGQAVTTLPQLELAYSALPDKRPISMLSKKFRDGSSIGRELDASCSRFNLLLNRLISCRDSAQHGGPINNDCVESVVGFASYISRMALRTVIEAILKGEDIEQALTDKNDQVAQKHLDLNNGASPARFFQ